MYKWWAPKVAYDVVNQCLLRDVLGLQIGDGTAQIMKLIISRQKLGRELAP